MIDWVKVGEQALAGGFTLLAGVLLLLVGKLIERLVQKPKEKVLLEIAELRGKGIDLRNWGEVRVLKGKQLQAWLLAARQLEDDIITKAGRLSKFEGQRLMWLDRVRAYPPYPDGMSVEQKQVLWNLGGLFERCDALMAKHRF